MSYTSTTLSKREEASQGEKNMLTYLWYSKDVIHIYINYQSKDTNLNSNHKDINEF